MHSIRRLYFYLVAFISVETVIWGVINLARTLFKTGIITQSSELAGGVSLVLVGLPIFILHWWIAQHDAEKDEEEHTARTRALFLYAIRLSVWVAMLQSVLAILNRLVLQMVQLSPSEAWVGGADSLADNLIVLVINGFAFWYFERILVGDWKSNRLFSPLAETRRLFQYIWMLYTFALTIIGVQQILFSIFSSLGLMILSNQTHLANAIVTALLSAPFWAWSWVSIQRRQTETEENRSALRLVVLYGLAILGAVVTISSAFILLKELGNWLTGATNTLNGFISDQNIPLSICIVAGVTWAYFDRPLQAHFALEEDAARQVGRRRFYNYLLAALGFGFLFSGMLWLGRVIIDISMNAIGAQAIREGLNGSIASMLVGLAVWLKRWIYAQQEAHLAGEAGDHARRSLVRKGVLYLAVFSGVVGVMGSAGALLFLLIHAALGGSEPNFNLECFYRLEILLVVAVWLAYFLSTLIQDGRFAHASLNQLYSNFPVLVLGVNDAFAVELAQTLERIAPGLALTRQTSDGLPEVETIQSAKAIVLPSGLLAHLPDDLRRMLETSRAPRLLVPFAEPDWLWLGIPAHSDHDLARETSLALRQLAEGQELRSGNRGTWNTVFVVLGWLFIIEFCLGLLASVLSIFAR